MDVLTRWLNNIHYGNCLDVLKLMPDEIVNCCVTSPPYWGLRSYGTEPQVWGGEAGCEHQWGDEMVEKKRGAGKGATAQCGNTMRELCGTETRQGNFCLLCGAWRGELGLEPTPELYVEHIVAVFREVRRVLRKDGTLWVNIGDSYAGSGCGTNDYRTERSRSINKTDIMYSKTPPHQKQINGCKPKDLVGIPWMVAFALRADGWYLRQDIIWHKPNPMPESVKDRCTKAHEYIFLLSKSVKYFYDYEAVQELAKAPGLRVASKDEPERHGVAGARASGVSRLGGALSRNRRSVWTINTKPFKGAHFATFPPELIDTPISAGSPVGGVVLDPFMGSGTVAQKAIELGRDYIGIDLKQEYIDMAITQRLSAVQRRLI